MHDDIPAIQQQMLQMFSNVLWNLHNISVPTLWMLQILNYWLIGNKTCHFQGASGVKLFQTPLVFTKLLYTVNSLVYLIEVKSLSTCIWFMSCDQNNIFIAALSSLHWSSSSPAAVFPLTVVLLVIQFYFDSHEQVDFEWRVQFDLYWLQHKDWCKKNEIQS